MTPVRDLNGGQAQEIEEQLFTRTGNNCRATCRFHFLAKILGNGASLAVQLGFGNSRHGSQGFH